MNRFWKEYWILYRCDKWAIQLKNNWHEWNTEEWHLISFYRKWLNYRYDYYFCFLGFQLRWIDYRNRKISKKY